METILCLICTETDGTLAKPALESIKAAQALVKDGGAAGFVVGLVGETVQAAADRLAGCGARRFLGIVGPGFGQPRYASDALAAEAICRAAQAAFILAPATARWNRVLAGVAHRLEGCVDTHITALSATPGSVTASRWYYRQRMEAVFQRAQRPWILLLEPGSGEPWQGDGQGNAVVEILTLALPENCQRTTVAGIVEPPADQQTIRPDATLLFVAGAGWTKKQADGQTHVKEAETLILDFLRHTRASLGSSKSLVDLSGEGQALLSFLTHLNQIGQTGATPRHAKGLSTCCHGEEPHAVGWRFVTERRAINLDPNCGWARGKADVLYVADAFAVMTQVNATLSGKKTG